MNDDVSLVGLGGFFFLMSFLTIGGATTALPDIYREFVEVNQWISGHEFAAEPPVVAFVRDTRASTVSLHDRANVVS